MTSDPVLPLRSQLTPRTVYHFPYIRDPEHRMATGKYAYV